MKGYCPIAAALLLASCATTPMPEEGAMPEERDYPVRGPEGECDASAVQQVIGQRATQELGARLLAQTGARTLRWVPPRTAVTMDFRSDRLTVSYDDNKIIERISCG